MMSSIYTRLFLLASLIATWLFADECFTDAYYPKGARANRIDVKHLEYEGIGFNEGYTSLDLFLSNPEPFYDSLYLFFDGRAHIFNSGKPAANVGLGCRYVFKSLVDALGLNAYYDYRNSKHLDTNQFGAGLEFLSRNWEFRVNGYLPLGKKTSDLYDLEFSHFTGHSVMVSRKYDFAMYGGDAEIGCHFKRWKNFDFYLGVGPYAFKGKQIGDPAIGGKLRVKGRFGEYINLEASDSYDAVFHNRFNAELAISIPFGPRSKPKPGRKASCCKQNIFQRWVHDTPYRNEIVVLDTKKKTSAAINPGTGQPYLFWFVDNTSSSLGTFESPFPTLASAQTSSRPNEVIYVFPGDGTPTGMDVGIVLQGGQRLLGSGAEQVLSSSLGEFSIPAQTVTAPTITNQSGGTRVITIVDNNEISGLTIQMHADGVLLSGIDQANSSLTNLTVKNNRLFGSSEGSGNVYGVDLTNASGKIDILNNDFSIYDSGGGVGIAVNIGNTNITDASFNVKNNESNGNTYCAISLTNCTNNQVVISDSTATNTGDNITVAIDNTAQNLPTNFIAIENNHLAGSGSGITCTFGSDSAYYADVALSIKGNEIFNTNHNVNLVLAGLSSTNADVFGNTMFGGTQGGGNPAVLIATANSCHLGLNMRNNHMESFDNGTIVLTTSNTSTLSGLINNNQFSNSIASIFAITDGSTGTTGMTFQGNQFIGGTRALFPTINASGKIYTVNNNTFTNQSVSGVLVNCSGSSNIHLDGNAFVASQDRSVAITSPFGGVACVSFTNNRADPQKVYSGSSFFGAYNLDGTGGTLNLEPVFGNIGVLDLTSVTNVSQGTCQ